MAVTRAKALLIIVGNPFLLRVDQNWNQLLQFVRHRGGYTGVDMVDREEEELDVLERLASLKLDGESVMLHYPSARIGTDAE